MALLADGGRWQCSETVSILRISLGEPLFQRTLYLWGNLDGPPVAEGECITSGLGGQLFTRSLSGSTVDLVTGCLLGTCHCEV